MRDEFLALEIFDNLQAARKLTAAWKEDYNHHRPHGSLGYQTPAEFAARLSSPSLDPEALDGQAAACAASAPAAPALQQHTRRDEEVPFPQPVPS